MPSRERREQREACVRGALAMTCRFTGFTYGAMPVTWDPALHAGFGSFVGSMLDGRRQLRYRETLRTRAWDTLHSAGSCCGSADSNVSGLRQQASASVTLPRSRTEFSGQEACVRAPYAWNPETGMRLDIHRHSRRFAVRARVCTRMDASH